MSSLPKDEDAFAPTPEQLQFNSIRGRSAVGHEQLYRYADDIQRLMERESVLELEKASLEDTARRQAERLREVTFDAQVSAIVLRHTTDGVLITDITGEILAVNPAFSRITGYAPSEIVGQRPSVLKSGLQGEMFYADLWRNLKESGQWEGVMQNRRKNGEVYAQWLIINPARDEQGRILCYVGVFKELPATEATAS